MTLYQGPPATSNVRAMRLIESAQTHCAGCRRSWRLRGWLHAGNPKTECTAKDLRTELRGIAAEARANEKARQNTR